MTEIFLAFIADLWIGDPVYPFHPVRIMGKMIERSEQLLRRWVKNRYAGGLIIAVVFPFSIFGIAAGMIYLCNQIHAALALSVNLLGIYTAVSVQDMQKEASRIYNDLQEKNVAKARRHLSRIVGRDTAHLDERDITRATIETVAESSVDGIIAPLIYAAIGGAPLALTYKAVNTLDSMIGHKNERYCEFGYFAAKIDDIVNWLPARVSYLLICMGAVIAKFNVRTALLAGAQQLMLISSVSHLPEATFAGALHIRLGGVNTYQGRMDSRPFLGIKKRNFEPKLILDSIRLMLSTAWVTLFFCMGLSFLMHNLKG